MADKSTKKTIQTLKLMTEVVIFCTAVLGFMDMIQIKSCNNSSFPMRWNGSYEGLADDGSPTYNTMRIIITEVSESGELSGICEVGVDESQPGEGDEGYYIMGSYYIDGSINWTTGSIEMYFDRWRYKGELENKRSFTGKYSQAAGTIEGFTKLLGGTVSHEWNMYAE